jgi:enoyl-CoA hydratase/carnithine racemase
MADGDILRFERRTNHVVLTLNRPEKRNALNRAMFEALDHALATIEADKSIRAMVLRGEGSAFSSGVDLRELEQIESSGARWGVTPQEAFRRLEALPVPTIAAVQGATLTGGLVLALLCDLRVAAENAGLGMTPARIGRVPDYFIFRKFMALVGRPIPRKSCSPPRRSAPSVRMRSAWSTAWWWTSGSPPRPTRWPNGSPPTRRSRCAR